MNDFIETAATMEGLKAPAETNISLEAATVPVVRVIDFSLEGKHNPSLLMTVMGEATLGPWAQAQLVPKEHSFPGPDGFFEFEFRGLRETRIAYAPFIVAATYRWHRFATGPSTLRGVRVRGANGRYMEKSFSELGE